MVECIKIITFVNTNLLSQISKNGLEGMRVKRWILCRGGGIERLSVDAEEKLECVKQANFCVLAMTMKLS